MDAIDIKLGLRVIVCDDSGNDGEIGTIIGLNCDKDNTIVNTIVELDRGSGHNCETDNPLVWLTGKKYDPHSTNRWWVRPKNMEISND